MFPLTAYIEAALELALYDKLDDGSFAGEIPKFKGVAAFGKTLREWLVLQTGRGKPQFQL